MRELVAQLRQLMEEKSLDNADATLLACAANALEEHRSVYVVFSHGDPMPITSCRTGELADQYADALARLPVGHPLRTEDAIVDELPAPLRNPEEQTTWPT